MYVVEAYYQGYMCGYLSLGYFSNGKWGHTVDADGIKHCAKFNSLTEAQAASESYLSDRLSFKTKIVEHRTPAVEV